MVKDVNQTLVQIEYINNINTVTYNISLNDIHAYIQSVTHDSLPLQPGTNSLLTKQVIGCSKFLQVQEQVWFNEAPAVSKKEEEKYEHDDMRQLD